MDATLTELDEAVAKARGWTNTDDGRWRHPDDPELLAAVPPAYSQDIAESWELVEELRADGFMFTLNAALGVGAEFFCCEREITYSASDDTNVASAICRAYLKARNVI